MLGIERVCLKYVSLRRGTIIIPADSSVVLLYACRVDDVINERNKDRIDQAADELRSKVIQKVSRAMTVLSCPNPTSNRKILRCL